jgi:hypothetical protein
MSSKIVRQEIKDFLTDTFPDETFIELDGAFQEIRDLVADAGITSNDPWVGLQFVGNEEIPITVGSTNTKGKYREVGAVYLHVVEIAKLGVGTSILDRAEALRDSLRGQRINGIIIESVSPVNFGVGASLDFEGGYTSGSFILSYEKDLDL